MEVTRGWGGRDKMEIGIDIYTLLYIKETTNKDLLYIAQGTVLSTL